MRELRDAVGVGELRVGCTHLPDKQRRPVGALGLLLLLLVLFGRLRVRVLFLVGVDHVLAVELLLMIYLAWNVPLCLLLGLH